MKLITRFDGIRLMKNVSDFDLLKLGIADNSEAFNELYNRHKHRVFNISMRICRNKADAEDAVQETFLTLFKSSHTFNFESQFTSWLYRITLNACLMSMRRSKRHTSSARLNEMKESEVENCLTIRSDTKDVNFMLLRHEIRENLEKAIYSLPEHYKVVYFLRDIYGLSTQEVCDQLAIDEIASYNRLRLARKIIKHKMEEYLNAA